ncbi:MAG: PcfB family protein [Coriobacteriales bacterium]|jgi:hypothetical protein|nr:PcfB family protein [Coriobacteriales bacterium]
MDATEQAIDQTLRIALTGTEYALRLSGAGAQRLAALLWSVVTTQQKASGKARLAALLKSGKPLKIFSIAASELAAFAKEAKSYGVLYAVIKSTRENPDSLVDLMVKADDASSINRMVEKLGLAKIDETDVEVTATRELDVKAEALRGEVQNDASAVLEELFGDKPTQEGAPVTNPTEATAVRPSPLEPSSKPDGRPSDMTIAEADVGKTDAAKGDAAKGDRQVDGATRTSKTRDGSGFDVDGRERKSVKAQIASKRKERSEHKGLKHSEKLNQTRHQTPQPTGRRGSRSKTVKGR